MDEKKDGSTINSEYPLFSGGGHCPSTASSAAGSSFPIIVSAIISVPVFALIAKLLASRHPRRNGFPVNQGISTAASIRYSVPSRYTGKSVTVSLYVFPSKDQADAIFQIIAKRAEE